MFTLDGDVFSLEFTLLREFRKLFGKRCLWRNRIGSNDLDTAEFGSLGGSLIAVQQSNIDFATFLCHILSPEATLRLPHGFFDKLRMGGMDNSECPKAKGSQ